MSTAEFDDEPELEEELDDDVDLAELPDIEVEAEDLDDDLEIDDEAIDEDDLDAVEEGEELDDEETDEDDEDEDEEDLEDDEDDLDDEESLEVLLARDKAVDDDDLGRLADESRDGLNVRPALVGAGEFTCRSCFLVKRRAQLADEKRLFCFDCA